MTKNCDVLILTSQPIIYVFSFTEKFIIVLKIYYHTISFNLSNFPRFWHREQSIPTRCRKQCHTSKPIKSSRYQSFRAWDFHTSFLWSLVLSLTPHPLICSVVSVGSGGPGHHEVEHSCWSGGPGPLTGDTSIEGSDGPPRSQNLSYCSIFRKNMKDYFLDEIHF